MMLGKRLVYVFRKIRDAKFTTIFLERYEIVTFLLLKIMYVIKSIKLK